MKRINASYFGRNIKKMVDMKIPDEGILVVYNNKPIFHIFRITNKNRKDLPKDDQAIAESLPPSTYKVDTFTTLKATNTSKMMGICSRCGRQGEVVAKEYVNEHGKYSGKYLCLANCYNSDQGPNPINLSNKSKEVIYNHGGQFMIAGHKV